MLTDSIPLRLSELIRSTEDWSSLTRRNSHWLHDHGERPSGQRLSIPLQNGANVLRNLRAGRLYPILRNVISAHPRINNLDRSSNSHFHSGVKNILNIRTIHHLDR